MILTARARYGLRATAELALREVAGSAGPWPMPVSAIARRQHIPEQYLRHVLLSLKRAGIVEAVRGKGGGYLLGRGAEDISALDVLRAMGEYMEPVYCVGNPSACDHVGECPAHPLWCKLADAAQEVLKSTTVAQLAQNCMRKDREPGDAPPRGYMFDI